MARARVVVVGAGLAGGAAALAARRAGAAVTILRGRAGASALGAGAYDLKAIGAASSAPLAPEITEFFEAARAPVVLADALVCSAFGALRPTRGRDQQALAIEPARQHLVPDLQVDGWDAHAIAASLDAELRARGGAGARIVRGVFLREREEMRLPLAELAARHDDDARVDWLADRLAESLAGDAPRAVVLLPAVVGTRPAAMARLRARLSRPVGEALGVPGGAATARFLAWTDRALEAADVVRADAEVTAIALDARARLTLADGSVVDADALVLATGGVLTGSLLYGSGEHELARELPELVRPSLRLFASIARPDGDEPISVWLDGAPLAAAGSLFGREGERFLLGDRPRLLSAGLAADASQRVLDRAGAPVAGLYVAGDLVAGAHRAALAAVHGGARAGRNAALD